MAVELHAAGGPAGEGAQDAIDACSGWSWLRRLLVCLLLSVRLCNRCARRESNDACGQWDVVLLLQP
ncbi:hypothetical protein HBI56_096980 [Parastagonospora nodorum]|nr:hypothetical protein HBH52_016290 [Parastagonospora nodorum]KAH3998238.1 hypothetical protein HBI10_129190 [Parastagonospora nodorum]KAH4030222.1 hypothetical protein HBI13_038380 [Parastagonospora nodorum]KAH4034466.1 hypothetical protein HBI09_110870 [Parastagonospora nodorum]KAH4057160.1 hypothetical protein HBH49_042610 [Parastagonospora nodorum]